MPLKKGKSHIFNPELSGSSDFQPGTPKPDILHPRTNKTVQITLLNRIHPSFQPRHLSMWRQWCDTSSVQLLNQSCICKLGVYSCVISENIQYKSKGILVLMKKLQVLPCKKVLTQEVFFHFVMGFLANVLLIVILVALLHFSPKMLKNCY